MSDLLNFLNMGGYAFYVWSSYGIAFIVLLMTYIGPKFKMKQILTELKRAEIRKTKLAERVKDDT